MGGSGKSAERPILSEEHIEQNVQSIQTLLERLLAQGGRQGGRRGGEQDVAKPLLLNNLDWFGAMPLLTFLRQVSTRLAGPASWFLLHHHHAYHPSRIHPNPMFVMHYPLSVHHHHSSSTIPLASCTINLPSSIFHRRSDTHPPSCSS